MTIGSLPVKEKSNNSKTIKGKTHKFYILKRLFEMNLTVPRTIEFGEVEIR